MRKAVPNFALSDAMRMSQASARLRPAPTANPLISPIVGLGIVWSTKLVSSCDWRSPATPSSNALISEGWLSPLLRSVAASPPAGGTAAASELSGLRAMPFTSPPAQNARPAPVSTTARTLLSRCAC